VFDKPKKVSRIPGKLKPVNHLSGINEEKIPLPNYYYEYFKSKKMGKM
jgi:hypothetical protein